MTFQVRIDPAAVDELVNSPDGPVGLVIEELSEKAAKIAQTAAPVMERHNFSRWGKVYNPLYQYGPPGFTKARTRPSGFRFNAIGQLYSGVNAPYGPTLFLERPARQIHTVQYMFLSQTLDAIEL